MLDSDRLTVLETKVSSIDTRFDKVIEYIEKGIDFREETKSSLAVIVDNQQDFKIYQKECDTERGDHEKRITANESFKKNVIKVATVFGGIMGFLALGGNKFIERVMTLFS